MRMLTTAVAVIALATTGAQVQAQGNGRDNRGGGNSAEAGQQGRGNGNAERGNRDREDRGRSTASRKGDGDQRGNGNSGRSNGQGGEWDAARAVERGAPGVRGRGNDVRVLGDRRDDPVVVVDRRGIDVVRVTDLGSIGPRGFVDGCPPGLAKKNPPCVPPGQVRRDWDDRFDRPDFWGISGLREGRYFYDDGYLVRLGTDGRIGGYIPLLGGALGIGSAWPSFYEPVRLPDYYESYYALGPYRNYRYADEVIYRVDPQTSAITAIAALLTGDQFGIGQPMPLGYDIYNVPYGYRDRYADGPDAFYRYSDGYVYEVDPETRLIAAAIELLAT